MKKLLMTLGLVAFSSASFAQGKIGFVNDSLHLFVLGQTLGADAGLGGGNTTGGSTQGALTGAVLPSGIHLVAGLYAGTSSSSLTLQTQSMQLLEGSVVPQAGRMASKSVILTGLPGGQVTFFQVIFWDNAFATPHLAQSSGSYWGASSVFTAIPGSSITYPPIAPQGGAASSTWAPENIVSGLGVLPPIPEPTTATLAILAGSCMLLFRRRKMDTL